MCEEEEKDMPVDVKVNIAESMEESLKEIQKIRNGELPKRSWREMMDNVRKESEK